MEENPHDLLAPEPRPLPRDLLAALRRLDERRCPPAGARRRGHGAYPAAVRAPGLDRDPVHGVYVVGQGSWFPAGEEGERVTETVGCESLHGVLWDLWDVL